MAVTYNRLYMDTRQTLLEAGVRQASLEARELVCSVSQKTREQMINDYHIYVPADTEAAAAELLRRRLSGEPLAYLIGKWDFFGLELDITKDVLIPRADTEILAQRAIEYISSCRADARVLDLCTGSGCIGLAIAHETENCRVVLADISEEALKVARRNARRHDRAGRTSCVHADALGPAPISLGAFDLIVCNPPYIPKAEIETLDISVARHEPHLALDGGADGLTFYRRIASEWKHALRGAGRLMFECGAGQAAQVCEILERCGYAGIEIVRDLSDIERVVAATPE